MTDTFTASSQAPAHPAHPLLPDLPEATHTYLRRAAWSLREALTCPDVPQRYAHAHVAALHTTAALLAARARPAPGRRRRTQRNAWVLLAEVAPELGEWARFFASGAAKRAAAEAGSARAVSGREADDLVRDADRFLAVVEQSLGLGGHAPFPERLPAPPQASSSRPPQQPSQRPSRRPSRGPSPGPVESAGPAGARVA